jgi:DNA-binding transcriptional MerR regulator
VRSSELARAAGVTVRTVRHYHQLGVLPEPDRSANGYRAYGVRHLARLLRIRQLSLLGIPLEDVPTILDRDSAVSTDEVATKMVADLDARISVLTRQRDSIARLHAQGHPLEAPAEFAGTLASVHVALGIAPDAVQTDMDLAALVDHAGDEALREGLRQALVAMNQPQVAERLIPLIARLSKLPDESTHETRTTLAHELWSVLAELAAFLPEVDPSHPLTSLVGQLSEETLNRAQRDVLEIAELLQNPARAIIQE